MSRRAVWGAVGRAVIVTAPIAAVLYLGYAAAGLPFAPFDVFDWMARVLPGSLVRFGVDTMVNLLLLLGLNVKDTAKTAEQLQAIVGFLVTLGVVGTVFLVALRERRSRAVPAYGGALGLLVAVPIIVVVLSVYGTAKVSRVVGTVWLLGVFIVWGLGLGWVQLRTSVRMRPPEPLEPSELPELPEPPEAYTRRRFRLKVGGAAAALGQRAPVAGETRLPPPDSYPQPLRDETAEVDRCSRGHGGVPGGILGGAGRVGGGYGADHLGDRCGGRGRSHQARGADVHTGGRDCLRWRAGHLCRGCLLYTSDAA